MMALTIEEIIAKTVPVRKKIGPLKMRAVEIFEDLYSYNREDVIALAKKCRYIEGSAFEGYEIDLERETLEFGQMLSAVRKADRPAEHIFLWPEGKIPSITEYKDNPDFRYNHSPDFVPFMVPVPVHRGVTPKGAVIVCAGGDHGDAELAEGYQTAEDLRNLGYQCFVLSNRTNHNPWDGEEAGADAARAVRIVRSRAAEYGIDPACIAFAGFSNGGVTGEKCIEYYSGKQKMTDVFPGYEPDALDDISADPAAFVCVYGPRFKGAPFKWEGTVYPPAFFAVGMEDATGAFDNLNAVYPDLLAHGVRAEVHTFAGVPHGQAGAKMLLGKVPYPSFEMWESLADYFLQDVFGSTGSQKGRDTN